MTPHTALTYRPDIDGLRAIAVLAVFLFHLDVPLLSGGYVGVDLFFVISGYLITAILLKSHARFSLREFYARRARRLFPALGVLLLGVALLAVGLLMPQDLRSLCQSLIATLLFGANLLFWKTAHYFDLPATAKPLLHTWSLSLEEQFYLVYPLLFFALRRYGVSVLRGGLTLATLLSFTACLWAARQDPNSAFYLLPFRAWELLVGGLLASLSGHPWLEKYRAYFALPGLCCIALALFNFEATTPFPGGYALLPVLGSALVIAGQPSPSGFIGRFLQAPGLVFFGLISYSLYLWHWPMIVFAKYYLARSLQPIESAAIFACTTGLAYLSWRYIENPFRQVQTVGRSIFAPVMLTLFLLLGLIGGAGIYFQGWPQRVSPQIQALAEAGSAPIPFFTAPCFERTAADIRAQGIRCRIGAHAPQPQPRFLLWGDSHALALAPEIHALGRRTGVQGLFVGKSACPPLLGVDAYHDKYGRGCGGVNDAIWQWLQQQPTIDHVVLAARWGQNINSRFNPYHGKLERWLIPDNQLFEAGLTRTVQHLRQKGYRVTLIGPIPEPEQAVPLQMAQSERYHHRLPLGPSRAEHHHRHQALMLFLHSLQQQYGITLFDAMPQLCPTEHCRIGDANGPFYRDHHHLNSRGAAVALTGFSLR